MCGCFLRETTPGSGKYRSRNKLDWSYCLQFLNHVFWSPEEQVYQILRSNKLQTVVKNSNSEPRQAQANLVNHTHHCVPVLLHIGVICCRYALWTMSCDTHWPPEVWNYHLPTDARKYHLTLMIHKWTNQQTTSNQLNPIELHHKSIMLLSCFLPDTSILGSNISVLNKQSKTINPHQG